MIADGLHRSSRLCHQSTQMFHNLLTVQLRAHRLDKSLTTSGNGEAGVHQV